MNRADDLLHFLRTAAGQPPEAVTDDQLLARFVERRDAGAFHAIVGRHGPMVWGVCLRLLRDRSDAEDAFQATFLVLVRKADAVSPRGAVGNWLYGVACRAALKARTDRAARREKERRAAAMRPQESPESDSDEFRQLLDTELSRLPDKYRAPVVLCDLEGKTRAEAAHELGWPEGTVAGRLARARDLLARRLSRRGLAATGGVVAAALSREAAAATLPPPLAVWARQCAAALAAGPLPAALVSPQASSIAEGVMNAMFLSKLKGKVVVVLAVVCVGLGVGGVALSPSGGGQPPQARPPAAGRAQPQPGDVKPMTDAERLQGTWDFATLEIDGQAMPPDMFKGSNIQVAGDRFTTTTSGVVYKGTFKVDAGKTPKMLDLTFTEGPEAGNTSLGIYELDGDTWKICLNLGGAGRPTEFATKSGSGRALETLKRRKAGDGPAAKPVPAAAQPAGGKPADPEAVKAEAARMVGRWSAASLERDGQQMPAAFARTGKRVVTDTDTTVMFGGQLYLRAKVTLDPTKSPRTMDYAITDGPDKGKTQLGIYAWDGEDLKVCLAPPGGDRPADFTTKPGTGRTLTVWKRDKD